MGNLPVKLTLASLRKAMSGIAAEVLWPRHGALLAAALFSGSAVADTVFTVDSTLDQIDQDTSDSQCRTAAGTCTLRAAVMQAGQLAADTTIVLPAGTYVLTLGPVLGDDGASGDLNFATPAGGNPLMTLSGAGASTTIIDASQMTARDRILSVDTGRIGVVKGVTLRGGDAESGGGVYDKGALTLIDATLRECLATTGGAIYNDAAAALTLTRVHVGPDNHAGDGGGIFNQGVMVLEYSTVGPGNSATSNGGGIANNHQLGASGDLTLDHSFVVGNSADMGGGLFSGFGQLTLGNSSVLGNAATQEGGGIYNNHGSLSLNASTLALNSAGSGGGLTNRGSALVANSTIAQNAARTQGGGILARGEAPNSIYITSSTIAYNGAYDGQSSGDGGGIYMSDDGTGHGVRINNSLLVENYSGGTQGDVEDCYGDGALLSEGKNLTTTLGLCDMAADSTWALLDSPWDIDILRDNGGPTQTIALLDTGGNNAIDGGDPLQGCTIDLIPSVIPAVPLQTDQRGYPRAVGAHCDIGAYEFNSDLIFENGFE